MIYLQSDLENRTHALDCTKVVTVQQHEKKLEEEPAPSELAEVRHLVRYTMSDGRQKLVNLALAKRRAKEKAEHARSRRKTKPANWHDVKKWFVTAKNQHMPQLQVLPSWTVKDRTNAKRMVQEFGEDLTKQAVMFFWEHFEAYRSASRGRLNGVPTPSLMYAMRSQVFTDVQLDRRPGMSEQKQEALARDEYDESRDGAPDDPFGWGV